MKQALMSPEDDDSNERDSNEERSKSKVSRKKKRDLEPGRKSGGTGLIKNTRKDGTTTWSYRYYDSSEGKTVWGETYETADEADTARLKARTASKRGSVRSGKLTVAGFAKDWPESYPEGRVESTLQAYKYGVRPFVEEFGAVKLRKLKRSDCKAWAKGKKRWMIAPAQAMLHDMWDDEYISANPLAKIKLPSEPGREGYPILSTDEVWTLIEIAQSELNPAVAGDVAAAIATSAFLGTRISETLALGCNFIDYPEGIVKVHRQVALGGQFKPPKGGKKRDVALPGYLKEAWNRVDIEPSSDLLFRPVKAPTFQYNNFNRYFRDVAKASGVKGLTTHELRRHCCQWLLHLDVLEWAANYQVGHGSFDSSLRQRYTNPAAKARALVCAALVKDAEPLPAQGRWEFDPSDRDSYID